MVSESTARGMTAAEATPAMAGRAVTSLAKKCILCVEKSTVEESGAEGSDDCDGADTVLPFLGLLYLCILLGFGCGQRVMRGISVRLDMCFAALVHGRQITCGGYFLVEL